MNILVVGCGNVGYNLAETLSSEGHEVTMVDTNAERLSFVADTLDIQGVAGNGVNYDVLMEAGLKDTDLFIAVTDEDEINLLGCLVANKIGKCKTIARVRNPEYFNNIKYIQDDLGLSMAINPELEAAREIVRLIQIPSAIDVDYFDKSHINMIKFKIIENSILDGMAVWEVKNRISPRVLVCIAQRGNEITIPNGSFVMQAGDIISFIAPFKDVNKTIKKVGIKTRDIKNVIISGGSRIAYYLADLLCKLKIKVKIIEKDHQRCENLSELLPNAMIICGNVTNQELLDEEDLPNTDAFISVTDTDEENIMLSLYAKKSSNAKVITKIKKITFKEIVSDLDIGSIVDPKNIVSESIVRYVRAFQYSIENNFETLYKLCDNKVEALEFNVRTGIANLTGIPLMELKLKDNILISAITRNDKNIIPDGKDSIEIGDRVIVVTTRLGLNDIKDILK